MNKRTWIIVATLLVAIVIIAAYFIAVGEKREQKEHPLLVNGLCESLLGRIFTCRADVELDKPIILSAISVRLGSQEATVILPAPLMIESSFSVTYTVTPSKASLSIHKISPPSIITFMTSSLYPSKDYCKLSLMEKHTANLTSGTAFPYESHIQPSSKHAYVALVALRTPQAGGVDSLASIDVKAFVLQDILAWEFYEARPAPLLPRTILIPLGGIPSQDMYYTKLTILYSKIADNAPKNMPIELYLYKTGAVHLVLKLRSGEVIDAVLPIYCH